MIYRSVALPCRQGTGNHVWSGYAYEPWTPAQKVFALSKFWSEARRNYVRMDRVGAERWDSLYLSLIEPARRTRNDDEFYRLMQRFCAFLEDEHTFVAVDRNYPQSAESFGDGWVLSLVTIDGRVVVNEVARAKAAEVPPGSEVVSVDGRPAAECLAGAMLRVSASNERARRYKAAGELLRGLAGTEHEVEFRRPDGSSVRVRLVNASGEYGDSDLASLPGRDRRSLRAPFRLEWYPGDVAYVKLGSFRPGSAIKAFHDAFPEIQGRARKLILDLRGNSGGRNRVAATSWRTSRVTRCCVRGRGGPAPTMRPTLRGEHWLRQRTRLPIRRCGPVSRTTADLPCRSLVRMNSAMPPTVRFWWSRPLF